MVQRLNAPSTPSGPVLWSMFSLASAEDVDRIAGEIRLSTNIFDPCPSWLIDRRGLKNWRPPIINSSLNAVDMSRLLKEAIIQPRLEKNANLHPKVLGNFRLVSNLPSLGKVIEWLVALQFLQFLDEMDGLNPFQPRF